MNKVFSRPLFKGNFIQRYAQGGIVSTVAGPEQQDPMAILQGVAEQTELTERNLDSANNIDEILTSFAGVPKTSQDARAELAELVGPRDAEATPESVLALVQPAMAIMEMSRQMGPQSGIGSMPMMDESAMMEQAAPMEGAAPTNFTQAPNGAVVPGFNVGGAVDYNKIMQDYAGMQAAIPRQYGADPSSAWLALAQLGAGMAQGKTFAQGLSMGTQLAAPVMQQGIQNVRDERSRLSAFVAAEATRQKEAAARAAELTEQRQYEAGVRETDFANQKELLRYKDQLEGPDKLGESERLYQQLKERRALLAETAEDSPAYSTLQTEVRDLEDLLNINETDTKSVAADIQVAERRALGEGYPPGSALFNTRVAEILAESKPATPAEKIQVAERRALGEGLQRGTPEFEQRVGQLLSEQKPENTPNAIQIADEIDRLKKLIASDPTNPNNKEYQARIDFLEKDNSGIKIVMNENKAAIELFNNYEKKKTEVYRPAQTSRVKQQQSIALLKKIQEIGPEKGGFWQGLLAEERIMLGQMIEAAGFNPGDVSKFVAGPEFGNFFQTASRNLSLEQQKDMARGTNLTLQMIESANANINKTATSNKLWLEVQDRVLNWEMQNDEYLSQLERYYGTDNPALLKRVVPNDPAVMDLEIPKKPLAKLTKAEIFDAQGRPLLSYDDYVAWRQIHEPAVDESTRQLLIKASKAPTAITIPTLPGEGPAATAPATNRDVVDSDASLDVTKPDAVPTDKFIRIGDDPEVFKKDDATGYYVGTKSGRKFDPIKKVFVTAPRQR